MIAGAVCCDAERRLSVANGTKLPNRASAFAPLLGVTRTYFKPAKNVTEVSERIAQPGYRIRVNDQNGDVIFVGVPTRLRAEDQDCRAA